MNTQENLNLKLLEARWSTNF